MNILLVRVGNLGDVLMVTPLARMLSRAFPGSRIDFLTAPRSRCVLKGNPRISSILIRRKAKNLLGVLWNQITSWRIRRRRYDLCFVLERDASLKRVARNLVGPGCRAIGFSGEGQECLDHVGEFSYDRHVIENYLKLCSDFCSVKLEPDDVLMDFKLEASEAAGQDKIFVSGQKYVLLHPGTTEYLPYRGWSAEGYAEIVPFLKAHGFRTLLTGQRVHRPLLDAIIGHCAAGDRESVKTTVDCSFERLAALIGRASAVVCSDTGILHLARAMQIPVVGLFGPSGPGLTGCIGKGNYRVIRNDFPCGPCNYSVSYRFKEKKNCLDGKMPVCMHSITAAQVKEALEDILFVRQS